MKTARLNGTLLSRKGDARPALAAVDFAAVDPQPQGAIDRPQDDVVPALTCDKYGRVRVSLRLDAERHLRLRLLAAHGCKSLQETLIAALDSYLGEEALSLPCECLQPAGSPACNREARAAGVQDPE